MRQRSVAFEFSHDDCAPRFWHHPVDATVLTKSILSPLLSCTIAFVSAAVTRGT